MKTNTDRFARISRLIDKLISHRSKSFGRLQSAYEASVYAAFKRAKPKSRKTPKDGFREHFATEEGETIRKGFQPVADRMSKIHGNRQRLLQEAMRREAEEIVLILSETVWTKWYESNSSTYSSQGFGACKYARQNAESHADIAMSNGIPSHIRTRSDPWSGVDFSGRPTRGAVVYYEVWSPVDELGGMILELKPDIPLSERVRLCWARGVNPRVYMPFLPVGYEEKAGLDYFGHRITKKEEVA